MKARRFDFYFDDWLSMTTTDLIARCEPIRLARIKSGVATMYPTEAQAIAAEQLAYWRAGGWTPEMAWQALTGCYQERNHATWAQVSDVMLDWLLANDRPAQLDLPWAA